MPIYIIFILEIILELFKISRVVMYVPITNIMQLTMDRETYRTINVFHNLQIEAASNLEL